MICSVQHPIRPLRSLIVSIILPIYSVDHIWSPISAYPSIFSYPWSILPYLIMASLSHIGIILSSIKHPYLIIMASSWAIIHPHGILSLIRLSSPHLHGVSSSIMASLWHIELYSSIFMGSLHLHGSSSWQISLIGAICHYSSNID